MFLKCGTVIKKALGTVDPRLNFISKYRDSFTPPNIRLLNLLTNIELPINSEMKQKIVLTLLMDYLYLLQPPKSPFFPVIKETDPPIQFIQFIAKKLLPQVIETENRFELVIIEKVIDVLDCQIQLSVYKDKRRYSELLQAISGQFKKRNCFDYFADKYHDRISISLKLRLLTLLRNILHSGPSSKIDRLSDEVKKICEICLSLLKSRKPKLQKASVRKILPIFFEHNSDIFKDVETLIRTVLNPNLFTGEENEEWPSVSSETFQFFFQHCFGFLNKKLMEFQKQFKEPHILGGVLDEGSIEQMLERLNQVAELTRVLLTKVSSNAVPVNVHRVVLTSGPLWMDNCTALLGFLKDAREVNGGAVDLFVNSVRIVRKHLQSVVDHVRRHETELQKSLPRISTALTSWTYTLKRIFSGIYDDRPVRIATMRERTIKGEVFRSTD